MNTSPPSFPISIAPCDRAFGRIRSKACFGAVATLLLSMAGIAKSADTTWTAGSATDLLWSTSGNWDVGIPTLSSDVIFSDPVPNPGSLGNPNVITLGAGSLANSLSFSTSYTLAGGDLTLGSGSVSVVLGSQSVIDSKLTGASGLLKQGAGAIYLTNLANDYTGAVNIEGGSVIISNASALGGVGAVNVTGGNSTPSNVSTIGFTGGSLVLDGSAGGFTFLRDLNLEGQGPIGGRGAALLSIGNNTLSGLLTAAVSSQTPATFRSTRVLSSNGTLTLSGTLTAQGTAGTTITTLGGINTAGVANYDLKGVLAGTGTLEKAGAGTLFLNASDTSGFSGRLRVSGSATGQQSSVLVTSLNDVANTTSIFGTANGGTTSAPIDMNGGVLEIRSDSSLNFGKNLYQRASSTIFVGPAVGGAEVNQAVTFGSMSFEDNITSTFNSRNGYGVTFTTAPVNGGNANSTITNNMGGTLSFTGNFWSNTDNGANRTMTIGGNGNTTINGNVVASSVTFNHNLTKSGSGALTITGTGSTLDGNVSVTGGSLVITDFRSIGNNTSNISLGNATTTAGNLIIGTGTTPSLAGLITSRPIILNVSTASNSIYANQNGANPVVLNGAITKPVAGNATLIFGGTNTTDNVVNVGIPALGTGGIAKRGPGTWVLAGTNAYTGATTISNGTLKIQADAAVSTILAATNDITFAQANQLSLATLEFVGQAGVNNVQTLDILASNDGANTIKLTPGSGGTASLVFNSRSVTDDASLNIVGSDPANNKVTINTGLTAGALIDRVYIDGNEFAISTGGVLRAPIYGTDPGFVTSATALTATDTNEITGSFTTAGSITIDALKINGGHTLIIDGPDTLTIRTGAVNTDGSILATGGSSMIAGGTSLTVGGTGSLSIRVNGSTDSLQIDSLITGFSGGLTKSGEGTLILTAANAQTGVVSINEGTIRLSGSGQLAGDNADLAIRQGAVLDLNGVTPATNTNAFNNAGRVINSSTTAATFTIGSNGGTGTAFGTVEGAINLTKLGNGVISLYNKSTYTGVTTIGGTVNVRVDTLADGGLPSGIGASTSDAANLVFNGAGGGIRYDGNIRDGDLTLGSTSATTDRLFTLDAAATGASIESVVGNNNALVWSNSGAVVNNTTADAVITLTGSSAGDNTFNPQLMDSSAGGGVTLSLVKGGTGQWNLGNSTNTYTGATSVQNGVLALNNNGALPSSSPVVLGSTTTNGTLQLSGTFARNLATTPTAGTGTITWGGTTGGGGFAAHTTALTVTLDGGAGLTWGSGGFVGTGGTQAFILNSGSSLSDVTFTNPINLGATDRTVTVNDNTNTGADFATLSGGLSGTGGGITKTGSGVLKLAAANTYTGLTQVQAGTLVVSSLGSSTGSGSSSVGADGVAMGDSNAIVLGNTTTTGGILQYVGAGETSDRKIRLQGTTAGNQIHADGTGALILTNVAHDTTASGNKTLSLRGTNTQGNMITSVLSNNGTGVLSVTVDGGATWILTNPSNSYSGTTTVGAGALGIGDNTAIGAGTLVNSNGNIFAYGGDRTITNTLSLANNAANGWIGDFSLTFAGANNFAAGANNITTNNSIVNGKALTFEGLTADVLTGNRTWTIDGPGETVVNGNFTTITGFGVNISKVGNGILTLGTSGATSNWNQAGANIDVDRGTLKFTASNAIPITSATNGGLILSPEILTTDTATLDLNGTSQTVNALTAITDGTVIIDNTSATAAALRFGANDSVVNFGSGIGSYTITDSGAGALSIVKLGNTSTTFSAGLTLTYEGATRVEGGGLTIASPLNGTTALEVVGSGSTLSLTGGLTTPTDITSILAEGGTTLSLLDGVGSHFNNLTNLQLGSTGGIMTTLGLNVGDLTVAGDNLSTDLLNLLTSGTLSLFSGNQITLNLTDAGLNANQTYNLISVVDGGLTTGVLGSSDWILGATPGGFTTISLIKTDTGISLTTGTLITGASYWNGTSNTTWNVGASNWSTDKAGTLVAGSIPGQGTDVIFQSNFATAGAVVTTLEQNFKINSLTFEAGTITPTSVNIDPGAVSTNRLEIAPQASTDGIAITAGGPATVTISAPLKIGADQTWNVADTATVLTLSGGLQGTADVTKSGDGKVILSAAADPTFNGAATSDFTISAGTLEMNHASALGSNANSNAANIIINGGAFYYNGATATVNNSLTLGGGTLSAGGANQTYNGTVNISGNSFINMAESNGPSTDVARNITLSGVVSGSGNLTVSSNTTTLVGGNAEGGTLLISNAASSWNGDLILTSGTVDIPAVASPTVTPGDITFDGMGRLIVRGVNGQTINRSDTLTFTAGSIGEYLLDNSSAALAADFEVNQNGQVNLGSGGAGANARFTVNDAATRLNIAGAIVLGGNSSISVDGGDADSFVTLSGIISDGGSGYSLAINDDAGGWAVTNDIIRLTGANTFTGDISLAEGILEFDTVTNISGGASALGNGAGISMAGGTLRFIGSSPQSTDRPITTTGSATLSTNGATPTDSITFNGPITQVTNNSLTLGGAAGQVGNINGGITQVGDTADLTVNGGTWNIGTGTSRIGDDATVTGADTVLNLGSGVLQVRDDFTVTAGASLNITATGALSFNVATLSADASLRATTGGTITIDALNAVDPTQFDAFRIGTDAAGIGTLVLNANQTVTEFILGNRTLDNEGLVNGSGILTVGANLDLYEGTINANLASTGSTAFEKIGPESVTLKGDNRGLASTGDTTVHEGTLILDYTAQNNAKISPIEPLDMRGGNLVLSGNDSASTSQAVGGLLLNTTGGNNSITLNKGAGGNDILLTLGNITRANSGQDATIRFYLPVGTQTATNGITTSSPNSLFGTLGTATTASADAAYATVNDGSGTFFATKVTAGVGVDNIVALASTAKNDVTTWLAGDHITDETTGFTGTVSAGNINTLRFDTAGGSDVNLVNGTLLIRSGGILVTDQVTLGAPGILGGTLVSDVTELIVHQDSVQTFEITSFLGAQQGITKTGTGTLLLSGNNNYNQETEIHDGTLQVSGGNAISDVSIVTLAANRNSTLELLADETIGRLQGGRRAGVTGSEYGVVAIGSNTLRILNTSGTTYSGFFTGTGTLVKDGPSDLNLQNTSTAFAGSIVIDSGTLRLSNAATIAASDIVVNKGGSLYLDMSSTTRSAARILDTTPITLNSADGTFSSQTVVRGLAIFNDQDGTADETLGVVNINSGASYVGMGTAGTNDDSDIIASNILRFNSATLNVRGTALGSTDARNNQFRIVTANDAPFIAANLVGGGGAAGSQNLSIVPWAIGESFTGNIAAGNMGNSLVTYVSGAGFRPLNFATEYDTIALAAATDNARESLAADLTGLAGTTVNSLVLDNANTATINVTGAGAGNGLAVTSGAMLFTVSGPAANSAFSTNLGGFDDGITVGGTNEYVLSVVNPNTTTDLTGGSTALGSTRVTVASTTGLEPGMAVFGQGIPVGATVVAVNSATTFEISLPADIGFSSQTYRYSDNSNLTVTIGSPLTSAGDITKSGRGTLILSGTNTAGGASNKTTINEGILEIAGLSNIGGATGDLVFAGGTLRLGAGLTDDISSRTISILDGGATIDTNGVDLALANSVGSGFGGLTKTGAGNLTLNAAATYLGSTTVLAGTVTIGTNNAIGSGDLLIGAGATVDIGANNIAIGQLKTFGTAAPILSGTGTITASNGYYFTHRAGASVTVDAVLAGSGGVFKNEGGDVALNGANTYSGATEIQNGTLTFGSIANVGGGASALGAPTTVEEGTIQTGLGGNDPVLTYTGTGHSTDRIIQMNGTAGGNLSINGNGTGALALGTIQTSISGDRTLILRGTSDPALVNTVAQIKEIGSALTLNKADANTWMVAGASSYTGATNVDNGTLQIGVTDALPVTTTVRIGTGTTAGTLDTNGFDQTIGSLLSQTNSVSVTNNLIIDSANTLTVTGPVTIGANAAASTTLFTATGGGAFENINNGGTFGVGGATGATNVNAATADFSGLSSFAVNLGSTGNFRVGDANSNSSGGPVGNSTLILASTTNTITSGSVNLGQGAGQGSSVQTLSLGAGDNAINTDTINIGGNTTRSGGAINFVSATGSVTIRGADGTSPVTAINMVNGAISTGFNQTSDLLLAGHDADVAVTTLTMAARSASTGAVTSNLTFDQGTLDITTLNLASRTGSGTGNAAATATIGGGTTTIDSLNMAVNTSAGGTVTADFNVTAGDVSIGTGSGTAINMANAAGSRTTVSNLTLEGGNVTVTGNIIRTGGAGSETATLTLDGSNLDMSGNSVGSSGAQIMMQASSGTLTNLAQLNDGGTLTKDTVGTLTLGNGNTFTGGVNIAGGTLLANNTTGSATGSGPVSVDVGAILGGDGIIAPTSGESIIVDGDLMVGMSGATGGADLALTTTGVGSTILNGKVGFDIFSGAGAGDNTAVLGAADLLVLSGPVTLGGTLAIGDPNSLSAWASGDKWRLFDWALSGAPTGTFTNLTGPVGNFTDLPDLSTYSLAWDVSDIYLGGTISVITVPEPGRLVLVVMGVFGLVLRRRRRV
jgi:autotransporter-associated beta strand protein